MPNPLDSAFARAQDEAITLRIERQQLQVAERTLEEAIEINGREQAAIRQAIAASPRNEKSRPLSRNGSAHPTNRGGVTSSVACKEG